MFGWRQVYKGSNCDGRIRAEEPSQLVVVGQHKRTGLPIVKDTGTG